jgi:hypothetical protein
MMKNTTNAKYVVNFANKNEDGTYVFETSGVFDILERAQAYLKFKFNELKTTGTVISYEKFALG